MQEYHNTPKDSNQYDFPDKIYTPLHQKKCSYIYALLDENKKIVYVGKTKILAARIATHTREKKFKYYKFFEVPEELSGEIELKLYAKYLPIYNKIPPVSPNWTSIEMYRQKFKLKGCGWKIRNYIKVKSVDTLCGLYPISYLDKMREELKI